MYISENSVMVVEAENMSAAKARLNRIETDMLNNFKVSIAYARRFQSIPHILYPISAPSFCSQRKGKSVNIPPRQI